MLLNYKNGVVVMCILLIVSQSWCTHRAINCENRPITLA